MSNRQCPDCSGLLIDLYDPNDKRITFCPVLCTVCDALWIDEVKVTLPANWEQAIPSVMEMAQRRADEELAKAKEDNDFRAKAYFERVFYHAFTEGFLRAFAYFKHKYKDGRLKRIRDLWDHAVVERYGNKCVINGLTKNEFEELTTLINLGRKL